jgi:hypothetical protein
MGAKMQAANSDDMEWLNCKRLNHPHLADIAEQHGKMIEVAILAGDRQRAMQIVDRAFDSLDHNCIGYDSCVSAILGERIAAILAVSRIRTIADLTKRTRADLLSIRQISWDTLRKIISAMHTHGYELKK